MRIAHIATGYPVRFHGGITNYVRALAEAQSRAGHEVTVFAGAAKDDRLPLPFLDEEFHSARLRPFSLRVLPFDESAERLADRIAGGGFDVAHFHMGLDLALNFYDRIAAGSAPYVVSIHDYFLVCPRITMIDYANQICRQVDLQKCSRCIGLLDQIDVIEKARRVAGAVLPRIPSRGVYRRSESLRRFLRGSARALPVSSRVEQIVSALEPQVKYQVMHIGNASAAAAVPPKEPSERIRVTLLGVLSYHKGAGVVEKLLDSVKRSDLEFHFYGRVEKSIEQRLSAKGLIAHGLYKPADLPQIMSRSDLGLVCPIWEDNAPQVVMEFLNFGVPVVGARIGGIPDFVNERNGILFDPYSDADIARVAAQLEQLTHEDIAALVPREKLKTPEQHGREVLSLYEEILRERV
jgi:glycosyltransferase involved in cell wall biosynthesis